MRKPLIAITAALLLVSGCSSTGGAADSSPPTGTNAASRAATQEPAASQTPADDGEVAFGSAFTWEDGLSVTVSKPKAFKPSEFAAGAEGKHHVVITVTVVNKTGKAFDPSLITMTLQSGDNESSQIFDSEHGIKGSPDTKLLNGRQAKFKAAFSVANPKDLVLELAPDFEHDSALWTTSG